MNLAEIRKNKALVEWWAAVMTHPNFQVIWTMMNERHPLRFMEPEKAVTTDNSNKRLGEIEGYELALRRLELCSVFEAGPQPLPPASFPSTEEQLTEESNASPS